MRTRGQRQRRRQRRGFALVDVIIGGIMLAVGLSVLLTITSRSLAMQTRGEKRIIAAWLADEVLSMVLVEGPDNYALIYDTGGRFQTPFDEYEYEVELEELGRDLPYRVTATIWWGDRATEQVVVQTDIALRKGDPEQPREPLTPLDRDARYYDDDEE